MDVTVKNEGSVCFVTLNGRLDTTNVQRFNEDMIPVMNSEVKEIELDCAGMSYTSSQGLRSFLTLQKKIESKGAKMVLKNMQPNVKQVFDITGFSNIFKII